MTGILRVINYARLSQLPRGGGLSDAVDIQLEEGRDYSATQPNWEVVAELVDNDISASKYSTKPRKDYETALEMIRNNQADVILVTEMSRLYRRLEELLELIHLAENSDLKIIATTQGGGYDLSTGEGIHNAVSAVNNAVLESRLISDREKRRKAKLAKEGRYGGGSRCYGYEGPIRDERDYIINRGRIGVVVVEEEAEVIRQSAERLLDGWPVMSIISDLNKREVQSAYGGKWSAAGLKRIFRSKRIIGIRTHHANPDVEYPAVWPSIIEREQWERIQVILSAHARFKGAAKKGARSYLLTGLIHCGICGKPLFSGKSVIGRTVPQPQRRYRCHKNDTYGVKHGCGGIARHADPVELLVGEAVLYRYNSPEFAQALRAATQETDDDALGTLLDEAQGYKLRLAEVRDAYSHGRLSLEDMLSIKETIEDSLEAVNSKMRKLESGQVLLSIPAGDDIYEAWEKADFHQRCTLVSMIVEKVEILPGRTGGKQWRHERSGRIFQFDPSKVRIHWRI